MNYEFATVGEILIDFTPAGKSETGAVLYQQNLGGATTNVACAISKLGRRSAFIGMAGNDNFGQFCRDAMQALNVDTKGLRMSVTKNTTLAFVHLSDAGDRSFSFYRKNSADISLEKADLDIDIVRSSRIFHFGGVSLSDEPSRSATIHAVQEAQRSGSIISFDPNLRMNLWESAAELKTVMLSVFPYADIIKLSDEEVTFIFDTMDYGAAIEHINKRFGAKLTIVTCGPRGAMTVAGGRLYNSHAYDVKTIDTTGSGDCFFAGALHCLLSYQKPADELSPDEIEYMLAFANASGSLASTKLGAVSALPTVEEIEQCMKTEKPLIL
ncbi:MAG: carbohydrate kinase [Oscillospiraceae bacterium]|nr:carbohydrate kinase [Oscillospiraceae bacterium]